MNSDWEDRPEVTAPQPQTDMHAIARAGLRHDTQQQPAQIVVDPVIDRAAVRLMREMPVVPRSVAPGSPERETTSAIPGRRPSASRSTEGQPSIRPLRHGGSTATPLARRGGDTETDAARAAASVRHVPSGSRIAGSRLAIRCWIVGTSSHRTATRGGSSELTVTGNTTPAINPLSRWTLHRDSA